MENWKGRIFAFKVKVMYQHCNHFVSKGAAFILKANGFSFQFASHFTVSQLLSKYSARQVSIFHTNHRWLQQSASEQNNHKKTFWWCIVYLFAINFTLPATTCECIFPSQDQWLQNGHRQPQVCVTWDLFTWSYIVDILMYHSLWWLQNHSTNAKKEKPEMHLHLLAC